MNLSRWIEQQRASERWFNDLALDFYQRNAATQYPDYLSFLESCAFFVTMTFSTYRVEREKKRLALALNNFSVEIDNFHNLYGRMARKLFGGDYNLPKFVPKLPLAIACVDYEGSRFATTVPARPQNVHVHAVWIVHPSEIAAFRTMLDSAWFQFKLKNGLHADQVAFDPYRVKKGRVGGIPYRASHRYTKPNKSLDAARRAFKRTSMVAKPY